MRVLVVNTGSSSVKLRLLDGTELIGATDLGAPSTLDPYEVGDAVGKLAGESGVDCAGHRIVHGGSAFTFRGTLDVRVQKTFASGRSDVSVIADVYNVPSLGNEVSEYVVSGPAFRAPTALQQPLTAVAGVRVKF